MKKQVVSLVALLAVVSLSSCDSSKKTSEESAKADTTVVTDATIAKEDAVVKEETAEVALGEEKKIEVAVTGTVQEINKGKDGYTAKIADEAGKTYNATISIPNLKDPKQYRSVAVGEKISVKGESFASDADNYIVVRELLK